jgi:hypothetical protein
MSEEAPKPEVNSSITARNEGEKKYLHLKDEEIDPVEAVTELLRDAGHPNPTAWQRGLPAAAFDKEFDFNYRRTFVNRKLIEVMGMADENTMDARLCLVDTGLLSVWLLLIKQSVVPIMVRLNLPNDKF